MRLLDLYCGAGGAGEGYRRAGYTVTGIDLVKRACGYPAGEFIRGDVLDVLADVDYLRGFDLIHASPPCQTHTRAKHLRDAQGKGTSKVDLIDQTRDALVAAGVPFILENVPGAPVRPDVLLCGSMFPVLHVFDDTGRRWLQRHRIFEIHGPVFALQPPCAHRQAGVRPLGVYAGKGDNIPSGGQTARTLEEGRALMGDAVGVLGGARRGHPARVHRVAGPVAVVGVGGVTTARGMRPALGGLSPRAAHPPALLLHRAAGVAPSGVGRGSALRPGRGSLGGVQPAGCHLRAHDGVADHVGVVVDHRLDLLRGAGDVSGGGGERESVADLAVAGVADGVGGGAGRCHGSSVHHPISDDKLGISS